MNYLELLNELKGAAEIDFAKFQEKLIPTQQKILGVRTPIMRNIAKKYQADFQEIFAFPDEYYEVTFIKLTQVSKLPYEQFIGLLEQCVQKIDNWATCDSFKAISICNRQEEFLHILNRLFKTQKEFYQRYVLVVFLTEYMQEKWLPTIKNYLQLADTSHFYVHMAAAWLTAEIIIKHYDYGVTLLKESVLDIKTHNKAIQKARESFRLTTKQKEFLNSLKIKINK